MNEPRVPRIFDRSRRAMRFDRARRYHDRQGSAVTDTCGSAAYVFDDMIEDVLDRLDFMRFDTGRAEVVGDMTGSLAAELSRRGFDARQRDLRALDEETPWGGERRDLVVSLETLGTLNDLPGALLHARAALADEGLYLAQMIGAGSLSALRNIMLAADGDSPAARIHPQVDNRSAAALLQRAGFSRQVVDSRSLTVRFSSFARLIADLRQQGLTGVLADRPPPLTKDGYKRALAAFDDLRDDEGKVSETFEILALTGWR